MQVPQSGRSFFSFLSFPSKLRPAWLNEGILAGSLRPLTGDPGGLHGSRLTLQGAGPRVTAHVCKYDLSLPQILTEGLSLIKNNL